MLNVAALHAASSRVVNMFSPSKTGRVRVPAMAAGVLASPSTTCFRYDPYAFRVLATPLKTPATPQATVNVPAANRGLLNVLTAPMAAAPVAAPTVEAASSATRYASIRFKHDVLVYVAPFRVSVGDMVLVEGDRGEDLGTVEAITTDKPSYPVPLRISRKATQRDKDLLAAKRAKEDAAVRSTQKLADSLNLSLTIADCEFQYDYNKLTVFFQSKNRHVDFRKLQRGLFREFRCRIWLTEAYRHIDAKAAQL